MKGQDPRGTSPGLGPLVGRAVKAGPRALADEHADCLSEDQTSLYVRGGGSLDPAFVLAHLDACEVCRITVGEAARELAELERQHAQPKSPGEGRPLPSASASVSLMTLSIGELVASRYEILRFIDRGGMGEVYEARDCVLGEVIALKTLACTALDDRRAMKHLMAEVRLARQVTHPNVCRIMEFGFHHRASEGDGEAVPFLTMPLLRGETMDSRITKQAPLAPELVMMYLTQVTAGLEAIHAAGIVHRDINPKNIFVIPGAKERVVLMDFGLARSLDPRLGLSGAITHKSVAGTLDYMAPEQLEGKPPAPSCDVYAVGVLMYEMITGQKPFRSSSLATAMVDRAKHPPRAASALVPGLDPRWDRAIRRCLALEPQQRFASVREIALGLIPPAGRAPPPRPAPRKGTAGAWAEVFGLLALAIVISWRVFAHRDRRTAQARESSVATASAPEESTATAEILTASPAEPGAPPLAAVSSTAAPSAPLPARSAGVTGRLVPWPRAAPHADEATRRRTADPSNVKPRAPERPVPEPARQPDIDLMESRE
jgi:hypothetical protein